MKGAHAKTLQLSDAACRVRARVDADGHVQVRAMQVETEAGKLERQVKQLREKTQARASPLNAHAAAPNKKNVRYACCESKDAHTAAPSDDMPSCTV